MKPKQLAANTLVAIAIAAAMPIATAQDPQHEGDHPEISPGLARDVRHATQRFQDVNAATAAGYVSTENCVSGPNEGAMGVHLVRPDRIFDGVLNAEEPEALIYEPGAGGTYRFVGVEFIAAASTVDPGPSLEGHLLNYVGEPNRYGLPAFFEMHVWAWEDNPKGNFVDWNTNVSCDKQPGV